MVDTLSSEFQLIPLSKLELGEKNIRRRDITAELDELAHSMATIGLQQPIVVQRRDDKFEIIIGQRRYFAAKQLGWKQIPARVMKEKLDEFDARVISFSENVQRRELSPRDKAETCMYLISKLGSPKAVAEHLGITEQTVRKWLDYSAVPEELKRLVEKKVISRPQATRLFQYIHDVDKAVDIAKRMREMKAPKKHQDRIFDAIEEKPSRSVESIFIRAEEKKREKLITFVLPEKWAFAMDRAVKRLGVSADAIARDATIEWLQMTKY